MEASEPSIVDPLLETGGMRGGRLDTEASARPEFRESLFKHWTSTVLPNFSDNQTLAKVPE
jgi:hypothetical protein